MPQPHGEKFFQITKNKPYTWRWAGLIAPCLLRLPVVYFGSRQRQETQLMPRDSADQALADPNVIEAMSRGIIQIDAEANQVEYNLNQRKRYNWADPEEWVRARTIAFLVVSKGYPANRIRTEVPVPRRVPNDSADIVVFEDDRCLTPYVVVENKAANQTKANRAQWIEQLFGNCNSLRSPLGLYDEGPDVHILFDVANFPPGERQANRRGGREALPDQYGNAPTYAYVAGTDNDIHALRASALEARIRRSHSIIWAGGKRDPLAAFDEWTKLLFAKVVDEKNTPDGQPRQFQVGTGETIAAVATRIHRLFMQGCRDDPTIFDADSRITLPDKKVFDVVEAIQEISFLGTDVDTVGAAFENFFGSIFRGDLGQYFTMRQLARFTVSVLAIKHDQFVIDPTAGSGGFLLEALLQVWHAIDDQFASQRGRLERLKNDFALLRVYGIEIHEILSRICKINLLLHHDGHTNIEGNRSALDSTFSLTRLQTWPGQFDVVVGNPPFGDEVSEGDEDLLGNNRLENFQVASGRSKVPSEHVIVERAVDMLAPDGRFGLVLPDGFLNNQGVNSNCPAMRAFLAKNGQIEAIVSLPDHAFRKSGAQNKTSIVFFRKFRPNEKRRFDAVMREKQGPDVSEEDAIAATYASPEFGEYRIFLAEANAIGYTATGAAAAENDLYHADRGGRVNGNQDGTVLGEWRRFHAAPAGYEGRIQPDCMGETFAAVWTAHDSHRLDPKYHLFKRNESSHTPNGWLRLRVDQVMRRRVNEVTPEATPDAEVQVMTVSQTGEIRPREAGKGKSPPSWLGMYFDDIPSRWFSAQEDDVVFSSIDLWKGCIAVVPARFDGAIVTKEFPIYEVTDARLDPEFLSVLLRTRYYQRAFRAITTGHSNRRRTQVGDFEALEICFPPELTAQRDLIGRLRAARGAQQSAGRDIHDEMLRLSDLIDGRGREELPEIDAALTDPDESGQE